MAGSPELKRGLNRAVVIVLYLITKWRGGSVGPVEEPEPTQSRYGG